MCQHAVNNDCTQKRRSGRARALAHRGDFSRLMGPLMAFSIMTLVAFMLIVGQSAKAATDNAHPIALLQTQAPVPLVCDQNLCTATLASISLSENSVTPDAGLAYVVMAGAADAISLHDDDVLLPLIDVPGWEIVSGRTYTSVSLTIPRIELELAGLTGHAPALTVSNPIAAQLAGSPIGFDFDTAIAVLNAQRTEQSDEHAASELIVEMLSGLPTGEAAPTWEKAHGQWNAMKAHADKTGMDMSSKAIAFVDDAMARCRKVSGGLLPVDTCLLSHHDSFVSILNRAYWRAIVPGA